MRSQNDLNEVFETTDYRVDCANDTFTLNAGCQTPAEIADWVAHYNSQACAWLITAHNPGGEIIADPENQARSALMDRLLDRHGLKRLAAVNRDPDGDWPDEPGWLVAGLEESQARNIARRFGQLAIVAVDRQYADLVWILL